MLQQLTAQTGLRSISYPQHRCQWQATCFDCCRPSPDFTSRSSSRHCNLELQPQGNHIRVFSRFRSGPSRFFTAGAFPKASYCRCHCRTSLSILYTGLLFPQSPIPLDTQYRPKILSPPPKTIGPDPTQTKLSTRETAPVAWPHGVLTSCLRLVLPLTFIQAGLCSALPLPVLETWDPLSPSSSPVHHVFHTSHPRPCPHTCKPLCQIDLPSFSRPGGINCRVPSSLVTTTYRCIPLLLPSPARAPGIRPPSVAATHIEPERLCQARIHG